MGVGPARHAGKTDGHQRSDTAEAPRPFGQLVPELLLRLEWSRDRIEQEQTDGLRRLPGDDADEADRPGLNAAQPTQLRGYASSLYELARKALDGDLRIQPTTVAPDGEPLLPEMRDAMERAWGVPVGGTYGTSEGCMTATSCFAAEGMHLSEDLVIVDVDEWGRAVEAGRTAAKIYLTNLFNEALFPRSSRLRTGRPSDRDPAPSLASSC
jgi:hypothetical protein